MRTSYRNSSPVVYYYDIYLAGHAEPVDTKFCHSSTIAAFGSARALKKEHNAVRVTFQNSETYRRYEV